MKPYHSLIFLILLVMSQAVAGQYPDRTLRLSHIRDRSYSEASPNHGEDEYYYYRPGQFAIIDSLLWSYDDGYWHIDTELWHCDTQISYPAPGHIRYDYTYRKADNQLVRSLGVETDIRGRKVYEYSQEHRYNYPLEAVWRYYPEAETMRADSVVTLQTNTYYNKLVYEYDASGRRDKSYAYFSTNGQTWSYQGYYQNSYAGALPCAVDTELWSYRLMGKAYTLSRVLDAAAVISSVAYHPASGTPTIDTFSFSFSDSLMQYNYAHSDNYGQSYATLRFNNLGKISFSSASSGDDWAWSGGDTNYYWEDHPLSNDDALEILPPQVCTAYPNPFRDNLNLAFSAKGQTSVQIFDLRGRKVFSAQFEGDSDSWDGRSKSGHELPAGIYFLQVRQGEKQQVLKILKYR